MIERIYGEDSDDNVDDEVDEEEVERMIFWLQ